MDIIEFKKRVKRVVAPKKHKIVSEYTMLISGLEKINGLI